MGDRRAPSRKARSRRNRPRHAAARADQRGHERRRRREVGGRLGDPQAAGDIEIDVELAELQPAMRLQHRQHHGEPARLPADHRAARRAERVGATSAWISTRSGRAPSTPANTAAPGLRRRRGRPGTARTGSAPRRGRPRSFRTRRPRRWRRSGSWRRAAGGRRARRRPRTRTPRRPCARRRAGRRSGRPWSRDRRAAAPRRSPWRSG